VVVREYTRQFLISLDNLLGVPPTQLIHNTVQYYKFAQKIIGYGGYLFPVPIPCWIISGCLGLLDGCQKFRSDALATAGFIDAIGACTMTVKGGCHCGATKSTVAERSETVTRCAYSFCTKRGWDEYKYLMRSCPLTDPIASPKSKWVCGITSSSTSASSLDLETGYPD
jgi:hypothetical protein